MSTRVRVYFNLHKRMFSVQRKKPEGWRLWKHLKEVRLLNVCYKVSEAGRQRVIREEKKNVHAYMEGDIIDGLGCNIRGEYVHVTYNPYKHGQFYLKKHPEYKPITQSNAIHAITINNQPQLTAYL